MSCLCIHILLLYVCVYMHENISLKKRKMARLLRFHLIIRIDPGICHCIIFAACKKCDCFRNLVELVKCCQYITGTAIVNLCLLISRYNVLQCTPAAVMTKKKTH